MGSENGDSDEKPVRTVRISRDFWMGKTEVTQAEYRQVTGKSPSTFKGDDLPVERVSWDDAVAFCEELTRRERAAGRLPQGYVYRLPTEAEWEYAAKGGSKSKGFTYAGGNDIDTVAWHGGNSGTTTHPVGKKAANELGLHDMSGNVWEWCSDWYQDSYSGLPDADPKGPGEGSDRVNRGGSWFLDASFCRSAHRRRYRPSYAGINLGFRVVLAPVP
jgi:formylglycine-generating enzyme required for sulfatase activity